LGRNHRVVSKSQIFGTVLCSFLACLGISEGRAQGERYSARSTLSVFALYSNDSSHIILGVSENRKLAGIGAGYSLRMAGNSFAEWDWEPEVRPLQLIQEPWARGSVDVVQAVGIYPAGTGPFDGQAMKNCTSATTVATTQVAPGDFYTESITQQCYSRWTYAGGISPLGQRVSFAKRHRWQPFLLANAGFVVSPRDVPHTDSSRFNFTFEGGAGLEWFQDHRHSWALDYRLHHLSNAYTGEFNPGIDSQIFRISYRLAR